MRSLLPTLFAIPSKMRKPLPAGNTTRHYFFAARPKCGLRFLHFRRPLRHLNSEQLRVLSMQSRKAGELHSLWTHQASHGLTGEKMIQHIEANVPPGGAHCDEVPIDTGPQRQTRAAT